MTIFQQKYNKERDWHYKIEVTLELIKFLDDTNGTVGIVSLSSALGISRAAASENWLLARHWPKVKDEPKRVLALIKAQELEQHRKAKLNE
jgi:hypothetical protein